MGGKWRRCSQRDDEESWGSCQIQFFFEEELLQGSEQDLRGSDLRIQRLTWGEQTEDGKGSSWRLGGGCDVALGRSGGGFDWAEAMDLVLLWVDDTEETTEFPGALDISGKESQEVLGGI